MTRDDHPGEPAQHDLTALFRTHADGLAGSVRGILGPKAETQELLQEAFLKAFTSLRQGCVPDNPVAWIFVITMNLARDQRRRRASHKPSQSLEETNPMELRSTEPAPTASLEREEALAAARAAILHLKETEKEVFLLRTSAGLSFDQAAQALGIPVGTAKTRMRAALIHLRQSLKQFAPTGFPQFDQGRQAR